MKVKLETFLREITEKTTINNQYPVLTSSKSGLYLQSDYFNKQVASKDNTGYKIIRKGQFTYRAMSDTGEFFPNMLECAEIGIVSPAYPVFEIVDTSLIVPEYLKYFFKSDVFQYSIASFVQGSTRTSVKFGKLKTISMELPDKEKQNQIIEILNATERIIERRKEELQQLDELVKARFVEMFGDYHTNSKSFEAHKGSELFKFSSGKFLPEEKRLDTGIPVYGGNGIAWYTDETLIDYPTIIIGRVGAWCGNIHMVSKPVWITDNAIFIKEQKTEKFTLEFLTEMMKIMDFHQYADYSGQPKITQKPLETLVYLTPPIEMQNEFTAFVKQVDKSKFVVQKALDEAQTLFDSLMQEYFG